MKKDKKHLPLSQAERKIYNYVADYQSYHGYSPTYKEIAHYMKLDDSKGRQLVASYIINMQRKGFIKKSLFKHRSLKIIIKE